MGQQPDFLSPLLELALIATEPKDRIQDFSGSILI
jgi:hypothetical protein